MSSSVATSQANVCRANCQCELNFLLITQREAAQWSASASGLITHCSLSPCLQSERLLLVHTYCTALVRRRRGVRPAATYWKTPHAGGETVAARLWLLTPYKTLLCTALCNVVLSPRLAAPALLCAISYSRVQVSFIRQMSALMQHCFNYACLTSHSYLLQ